MVHTQPPESRNSVHDDVGPFAIGADASDVSHHGERYVPSIDPYNAAMHLGHMAAYKHALRYAYGRRVLDIGCGTGYGAHYLASFGAGQVVAVDTDRIALSYARRTYAHTHVHYQQGGGDHLLFTDAAFEFVVSFQVIEHVADPIQLLAEIKRVLKPGGFCLIATPNKDLFSPNRVRSLNEFHLNEVNLAQLEAIGRAVFPRVEMAGIPQNCLVRQPDDTLLLKDNASLRLEDYQIRRDDLIRSENLLLFGHTQADGEFSANLPDSLSCASTRLAPCFWDAATGQWIELGVYPAGDLPDDHTLGNPQAVRQVFRSPYDRLFRIDIALERVGVTPVEMALRDQLGGQVLAHTVVHPPRKKLSLAFAPIADSGGREFCLELYPRRSLLDTLLLRKDRLPEVEYRRGQLAFWTFHQTLPANVS